MHYHFKIHKEKDGYWAECIEIPSCITQGDSKEELLENMQDAINTCIEEPEDSKFLAPLPDKSIAVSSTVVAVSVDPAIALAFSIRYQRIKKGLTQKQAASYLGMDSIFSYQRLEKKGNVRFDVLAKLMELFPKLSVDMAFR
jgi:antitoxin HicB